MTRIWLKFSDVCEVFDKKKLDDRKYIEFTTKTITPKFPWELIAV